VNGRAHIIRTTALRYEPCLATVASNLHRSAVLPYEVFPSATCASHRGCQPCIAWILRARSGAIGTSWELVRRAVHRPVLGCAVMRKGCPRSRMFVLERRIGDIWSLVGAVSRSQNVAQRAGTRGSAAERQFVQRKA